MQKLNSKNILGFFFLFGTLTYLLFVCTNNKSLFFAKYNSQGEKKLYEESQWQQSQNISPDKVLDEWAIKKKYTGWKNFVDENKNKTDTEKIRKEILLSIEKRGISDSTLYSYAGYEYINGKNPSLLNPEHPPLGKYLIGVSIFLFNNVYIGLLIISLITLLVVYKITYLKTRSFTSSSFAVLLTSLFPLFLDQLVSGPQLELFQLLFTLLLFYFILLWEKKNKTIYLFMAGFWYGCALSTKTFLPFFLVFSLVLYIFFLRTSNRKIAKASFNFGLITLVGIAIFTLSYLSFFLQGGTIRTFLGLQKYIIVFYQNAHIPLLEFAGNYIRLIITGSWKFWDQARTVSFYSQWNILWPLIFATGTYSVIRNRNSLFIIFAITYNMFLFLTPIFPRYLLLLFVPYIISICQFASKRWKK